MNAKEKAIEFFMKEEVVGCSETELPDFPLQLTETLDIAIKEAKKEELERVKISFDHLVIYILNNVDEDTADALNAGFHEFERELGIKEDD